MLSPSGFFNFFFNILEVEEDSGSGDGGSKSGGKAKVIHPKYYNHWPWPPYIETKREHIKAKIDLFLNFMFINFLVQILQCRQNLILPTNYGHPMKT